MDPNVIKKVEDPVVQTQDVKVNLCKPIISNHVDIIFMLSQITIKVPLDLKYLG